MPGASSEILVVGPDFFPTTEINTRFSISGRGLALAGTLAQARSVLANERVGIVLASECLPDGRGYELAEDVARHDGTLLVGVSLSENKLWLPVIERGKLVLGTRAIKEIALESEVAMVLSLSPGSRVFAAAAGAGLCVSFSAGENAARTKRAIPPKRLASARQREADASSSSRQNIFTDRPADDSTAAK